MPRKKTTVLAFLDTNIYLQFKDFDNIEWRDNLNSENVCIVVAPVNLSELERFKYDPISERRQKRSRMIIKKIRDIALSVQPSNDAPVPGRDSVVMRILTASPDISKYPGLQVSNWDDVLIATILQFIEDHQNIQREDIVLIADDSGVLIKGRANGINVQSLDDSFRLLDEPTVDQQKVATLERRLAEIENKEPKLQLAFEVNDSYKEEFDFLIKSIAPHDPKEDDRFCEEESRQIAWTPPKPPQARKLPSSDKNIDPLARMAQDLASMQDSIMASMSASGVMNSVSQQEIDRYERDKKEYLEEFRKYLIEYRKWREVKRRALPIDLMVLNDGTTPAIGVIVRVIIPDDVLVYDTDEWPKQPKPPERPHKPMTSMEMLSRSAWLGRDIVLPRIQPPNSFPPDPDSSGPSIKPYNSTLLEWERNKVLHRVPRLLTPVTLLFPPMDADVTFVLNYKLFAENIAAPIEGVLKINLRIKK